MRSEGLQAVQLALQELHNVYRKRALALLVDEATSEVAAAGADSELRAQRFAAGTPAAASLTAGIQVFREAISHDISAAPPVKSTFEDVVRERLSSYGDDAAVLLGLTQDDHDRIATVQKRTSAEGTEDVSAVRGGLDTTRTQQQEREQQQEQMKEREQEEEEMSQFCRDDEQPLAWKASLLTRGAQTSTVEATVLAASDDGKPFPFGELVVGDDAFYPLSVFRASPEQPALPFPHNLLVSSNYFRPSWAGLGDRRLKNISLVLEWRAAGASDAQRYLAVLSLTEAETVRRAIHTGEYGVHDASGLQVERRPLEACLALRTLSGHRVDAKPSYTECPPDQLASWLQCLRFFHGEMFYSDADLRALMSCLAAAPHAERERFFSEGLRRRRRERREWGDAPVARVFVDESRWAELRPRALLEKARVNLQANFSFVRKQRKDAARLEEVLAICSKVAATSVSKGSTAGSDPAAQAEAQLAEILASVERYPGDAKMAFERFDEDGDGRISRPELAKMLKALGVQAGAVEVAEVMRIAKHGGDGAELSCEEFSVCFRETEAEVDVEAIADAADHCGRGPWLCENPRCSAWNNPDLFNMPDAPICVYCKEQPRPDLLATGVLQAAGPPRGFWNCSACTLTNPDSLSFCDICGTARGAVHVREGEDMNFE
jgi:hypothetical protein